MKPKIVFFDCAQTLVKVDWNLGSFMVEVAESLNLQVPAEAGNRYLDLYRSRLGEYQRLNLTKNRDLVREFWIQINADWLSQEGLDPLRAKALVDASDQRLFSEESKVFQPFADVVPCLNRLINNGITLGIISNWDISLHRVLETFDLAKYFKVALASLEEGVEKPAKRLFEIALERTGFRAEDALHIGDDAWDDLQGARNAGMRAVLIDRTRHSSIPPFLSTLDELESAFDWPAVYNPA